MNVQENVGAFAPTQEDLYFDRLHSEKYRDVGQSKIAHSVKMAQTMASDEAHRDRLTDIFLNDRFIPAGRIQAATGATQREVSPFNCSVSQKINDDMRSIMDGCSNAAMILRLGTGIGYNFSRLRPKGFLIEKLQTEASGPISFMTIYDVMASTIASSGHRRGAMMGILNVDHPDIESFIDAKMVKGAFRQFNISVGITNDFMSAVINNRTFPLTFNDKVVKIVNARELWDKILKNAYESAEPGVVFLDRINDQNNLYYCEEIEATNPCAEQPLPPYGLCTLGSANLIKYIGNYYQLQKDMLDIVEAYDNIFDRSVYAIPEHKTEALNKRRIGLGYTGIANAIEYYIGEPSYGNQRFCRLLEQACLELKNAAYKASIELAKKRGSFPLFDRDKYISGKFISTLNDEIVDGIYKHGIRNSHLISYAPCGTISQTVGNISSGVEPIFYHTVERDVYMKNGLEKITLNDYMYRKYNFKGKTLEDCTIEDHLNVLQTVQRHTDSAVSKTINVASSCSFEDYKNVYMSAYERGSKGLTVFRPTKIRGSVITKAKEGKELNCKDGVCEL